jgi:hypothetical protein
MAKQGFKVMDSDIHVTEPRDLWVKYIEPRFKDQAPQFTTTNGAASGAWHFAGKAFPAYIDRPDRQRTAKIRRDKARARHIQTGRYQHPAEDLRGDDPHAMLQAMDREGIDVSIVFRTLGAHVIGVDGLDTQL